MLRWFGHVDRMGEYRIASRVPMAKASGGRVLGSPGLGWMTALSSRGIMLLAAWRCLKLTPPH